MSCPKSESTDLTNAVVSGFDMALYKPWILSPVRHGWTGVVADGSWRMEEQKQKQKQRRWFFSKTDGSTFKV
jgi:hypothetical protein